MHEKFSSANDQGSSVLIADRFIAILEPLKEQISNLTQLPTPLINFDSAKTTPTADFREHCHQRVSSLRREAGNPRAPHSMAT